MQKITSLLTFVFIVSLLHGQSWTKVEPSSVRSSGERKIQPDRYVLARIADSEMKVKLWAAPQESEGRNSGESVRVMLADGSVDEFIIREYSMMEAELAAKYPNFKTFIGISNSNPQRNIRIDYTLNGFRALIAEPGMVTYIDPYQTEDLANRIIYTKTDITPTGEFECLTESKINEVENNKSNRFAGDCKLRILRLAVAATGEYTIYHGGTVAAGQASIVTAMNRINGVFERDLSTRMTLIGNNSSIVYTDPANDPYTNDNPNTLLDENVANVNSEIGLDNYDIGHIFCTSDSGVAYKPSICETFKAGGVTGQDNPINDPFWIDYVAHEMGHQFGGNHTQNNNCNRASGASMEPGSGSTIMGYAGICPPDVQNNSDAHFHANSIAEMTANFSLVSCDNVINISNNAPVVAALQNYTVPQSTFLVLEASATDVDGDALTYCWEQMDPEVGTMPPQNTNGSGPVFRSISPSANTKRYLPNINAIIGNVTPTWEVLPSVSRTMNFRATVRDNALPTGCTDEEDMVITVDGNSGPFLVSESISGTSIAGGQSTTYTWTVAGTNSAPVNCSNVDILLSTDGGLTYPTTVIANTPNDGTQIISIPSGATSTARLMVKCSDNIFFDVNNADFTITGGTIPGFTMTTNPTSGTTCNNSSIQFDIATTSIGGFSDPISLSASALPSGATAIFSTNPITPGNSSTVTVSNFGSNLGNHNIEISGQAGSMIKTTNYALTLNPLADVPVLELPVNTATNISVPPQLSWNASSNALSYYVQIGTSEGASNVAEGAISGTSAELTGATLNTTYYWRVRAVNACGNSAYSSDFRFTTDACSTYMSTDIPKDIGVNNQQEYVSTLNISLNESITDINVVNLVGTHSWISDLEFILRGPDATEVTLFSRICDDEDNFDLNFDDDASPGALPCPPTGGGNYQPSSPLSVFNNKIANGEWMLRLKDLADFDVGSLTSWGLKVCYETPAGCDLIVTSTNPTGQASLMDAINCAVSGNTITIDLPANSVIDLGIQNIMIDKNLNITSNNPIFIDYSGSNTAILVQNGTILNLNNVTIRQVP